MSPENQNMVDFKSKLNALTSSLFALCFLKANPGGIDDIEEKLEKRKYKNTSEVFQDLYDLFSTKNAQTLEMTLTIKIDDKEHQHMIVVPKEDMEHMSMEMKKRINSLAEKVSIEDQLRENPLPVKILTALKNRFPNVTEEKLKANACNISMMRREEEWKKVVKELNQENENNKADAVYKKFSLFPSGYSHLEGENKVQQHIAGFHFYRMMAKWSQPGSVIPVPLRKVNIEGIH